MNSPSPPLRALIGRLALASFLSAGPAVAADGPLVVLVTIDTLRADHAPPAIGALGDAQGLGAWAGRGTQYRFAYSTAPSTAPAHTAMLTGLYPSFTSVGIANGDWALMPATTTLAERLSSAGVRTAAVVSNAVLQSSQGLSQGFGRYDDRMRKKELNRLFAEQDAPDAVDKVLRVLDGIDADPHFIWLHLQDPHGPYSPPPPWDHLRPVIHGPDLLLPPGTSHLGYRSIPRYQEYRGDRSFLGYAARYAGEVAYAGAELERFWKRLEGLSRSRIVHVILTADHGEALGEDGFYFAHGHSVAPDQVRVPLIVTGPGFEAGRIVDHPVSTIAVFRTVLRWFGLEAPGDTALPFPLDPDAVSDAPLFTESKRQIGVIWQGLYLQRRRVFTDPAQAGSGLLPAERIGPVGGGACGDRPQRSRMLAMLREFEKGGDEAQVRFEKVRAQKALTDEDRKALKALGYLE